MPTAKTIWVGARLDRLRELAGNGENLSAGEMAVEFGCSRNAVIGACKRNGINLPRKSSGGVKRQFHGRKANPGWQRKFKFTAPVEKPMEVKLADVVPLNLTLDELELGECRYPYGEGPFLFCGNPIEHGSYCAAHHKLCWVKAPAPKPTVYFSLKRKAA